MKGSKFVCDTVRNKDANGDVESVAVSWREGTEFRTGRLIGGGLLALLTAMLLALALNPDFSRFSLLPLGFALLFGFAAIITFRMGIAKRAMVFGDDGSIVMPFGRMGEAHTGKWRFETSDIVSVEVLAPSSNGLPYQVNFQMDGGESIRVAGDLREDHAVIVARRITKALGEIRAAQGADTVWASLR